MPHTRPQRPSRPTGARTAASDPVVPRAPSQKQCRGRRIDVRQYDTNADALLQLRTGRARAVLNDYPPAVALTTDPNTRSQYQLASTTQYEPGLYGIAVAKDNQDLREALE